MNEQPGSDEWEGAFARLRESLEPDGWTVYRSRRGVKARWKWLSVGLKHKPTRDGSSPWRARLRDGFPRTTVAEHRADCPIEALSPVIRQARDVARFCDGRLGLARNPSKSWMAHRLWQAVRPIEPRG